MSTGLDKSQNIVTCKYKQNIESFVSLFYTNSAKYGEVFNISQQNLGQKETFHIYCIFMSRNTYISNILVQIYVIMITK